MKTLCRQILVALVFLVSIGIWLLLGYCFDRERIEQYPFKGTIEQTDVVLRHSYNIEFTEASGTIGTSWYYYTPALKDSTHYLTRTLLNQEQ